MGKADFSSYTLKTQNISGLPAIEEL